MAYTGSCFCGAVTIEAEGEPEGMGYCHCASCRSWSGGPVNAFSLWKPDAIKVTSGAENIATFSKTPLSEPPAAWADGCLCGHFARIAVPAWRAYQLC